MDKLTVRDAEVAGKRVFVRVDFNVPIEDGRVKDDSRVRAAIPTILLLIEKGASLVLASHLGRPNGKVVDSLRLRPVAERLGQLLRRNVPVTGDALGLGTADAVNRLKLGEILLLENLRFHAAEEANDPVFAKQLASYADVYVNDAFGTAHRAHASTVGITEHLPAYAGLLMEREIRILSGLLESPEKPFAAVIGGAKVSDKLAALDNLVRLVDTFVVGGGMANTFLVATDHTVGKSLLERERVEDCRRILAKAHKQSVKFVLPSDVIVAKEVTRGAEHKTVPVTKVPNSWSIVDVGPASREAFEAALRPARTIFWNGPLGVFEVPTFGDGTRTMARYLARRAEDGVTVVVGGGDSVAAVQELGLTSSMTHISTGGGASLEFLEGRELPGIAALLDRPQPVEEAAPAVPRTKPARKPVARPRPRPAPSAAPRAAKPARKSAPMPAAKPAARSAPRAARTSPTAGRSPTSSKRTKPAATRPARTQPKPKPAARTSRVAKTKPVGRASRPATSKPAARTTRPATRPAGRKSGASTAKAGPKGTRGSPSTKKATAPSRGTAASSPKPSGKKPTGKASAATAKPKASKPGTASSRPKAASSKPARGASSAKPRTGSKPRARSAAKRSSPRR